QVVLRADEILLRIGDGEGDAALLVRLALAVADERQVPLAVAPEVLVAERGDVGEAHLRVGGKLDGVLAALDGPLDLAAGHRGAEEVARAGGDLHRTAERGAGLADGELDLDLAELLDHEALAEGLAAEPGGDEVVAERRRLGELEVEAPAAEGADRQILVVDG